MDIKDLTKNASEEVKAYFISKTYPRGSHILLPEDTNTSLYLMITGLAEVYQYAVNGMLISIYEYRGNSCFGEVELFCKNRTAFGVLAVEECHVIKVKEEGVRRWLESDPQFCEFLLQQMAQKIGDNCDAYLRLSSLTLHERVLTCILHHERTGTLTKLTKEHLATEVCAPLRSVNRVLAKCKEEGLIIYERHRFYVTDLQQLEDRVESLK